MPERRMPTMADAQRQVWVRGLIGFLLMVLALIFLILVLVKLTYFDTSFISMAWEEKMAQTQHS